MAEPKQERAARTRESILRAAAEVFDECGYSGASISKIMNRAGVTQGGMYFHFKSKKGLALAVMSSQQSFVDFPPEGGGLQRVIDLTFHLAHELQTNPLVRASIRLAVEQGEFGVRDDTAYQEWVALVETYLQKARQRGELLPEADEHDFAVVLVSAFTGSQLFSSVSSARADLQNRIALLWRYLLPGLTSPQVMASLRVEPADGTLAA
ncbi:ScbR family autoregulator-binding transcription factor [Streptomyces sp. NPDC000348]|uniref:ScbR family autoregulator-binding transcription factor n=1 Tax=Streptomyces sp. NPDC000348 TaxID=3364538 RepID=UPI0036AC7D6D